MIKPPPRIIATDRHSSSGRETADRAAAFRRAHHVGQILHGKVLRWVRGGMAWVHVGGQELLAQLQTTPEPGVPLRFLVVQLLPEIILKEVDEDTAHDAQPRLAPADILRKYLTARDALDAFLHNHLWPAVFAAENANTELAPSVALEHFSNFVAGNTEALSLFAELQRWRTGVNRLLAVTRSGTLYHLPWLMPRAKAVELLFPSQPGGTVRITMGAQLPFCGRTVIQCLAGTERMAYRLFLERDPAGAAEAVCRLRDNNRDSSSDSSRTAHTLPLACLGCGPLPADFHDVLTSALHPAGFTGGTAGTLNRRA